MKRLVMNGFIIHYNDYGAYVWFCEVNYTDYRTFQQFIKVDQAIQFCCSYQHSIH